ISVGAVKILKEVVVVTYPQGVVHDAVQLHICTKSNAFDFGRNLIGCNAVLAENIDNIQEESLVHSVGSGGCPIHVLHIDCASKVNLENLLHLGVAVVAAAFTVALINQEFVVIEGDDLADTGARCQEVCEFVRRASSEEIDHDHAEQV